MENAVISKIKAEIDKLYGEYKDKFHQCGDQYHLGLIDGLDMAERVLDTLESEKPMNPSGGSEIPKELKEASEKEYPCDKSWMTGSMLDLNAHCQVAFWKGAKWQKEQMMKEAVDLGTADLYWEANGDRAFPTFDPPVDDLLLPDIISQKFEDGQKVRIIIVKED